MIELPMFHRSATIIGTEDDKLVAGLIFATDRPTMMRAETINGGRPYWEILSMNPQHVDLERLNAGAPLLDSHSKDGIRAVIGGVIEGSAHLLQHSASCRVRFSRRAADVHQDVVDRVIRNCSVGYRVSEFKQEPAGDDGVPVWRAIRWTPHEISIVAVPADPAAQFKKYGHLSTADADRNRYFDLLKLQCPPTKGDAA